MPHDTFGREIDSLRIGLTDRCNLRCIYCMPLTNAVAAPREELLTPGELVLVVRAAVSLGFRKFRLTGGEPTLRPDLVEVVERLAAIPGVADLAMTTNGMRLEELAVPLARAGLDRVNVHVDTLREEGLSRIMRFGRLQRILSGIEAAEAAGLVPVKLNVVVVRGENERDVVGLARLTLGRDWHVRFIELMPLGEGDCGRTAREGYVSNDATRARIEDALGPLDPLLVVHASDESRNFRLRGARGVVGFISPVSAPYCGACNRMRLTAGGRLHLCLLKDDELDLRPALRSGGGEGAIREALLGAVRAKPTGHSLSSLDGLCVRGLSTRERRMHEIGG